MSFIYTQSFIDSGLTYEAYKQHINNTLALPPVDDNARQLRPRMQDNISLMNHYDQVYVVADGAKKAVEESPDAIWVVIAEGWCTDAAFSVPLMAAIEQALPHKVTLRIVLRDSNLELIDANLTDGGRSIPKLMILDKDLQEMATWGSRPEALHVRVKAWKEEGLTMKHIIPKMQEWYDEDRSYSIQEELESALTEIVAERV